MTFDQTIDQTIFAEKGGEGSDQRHDPPSTANASFQVNERKGKVDPRGEDLRGREILARAGLGAEKYELWTVVHGKAGAEIEPDQTHPVKPGDHFRATIRGTDYSSLEACRMDGEVGR